MRAEVIDRQLRLTLKTGGSTFGLDGTDCSKRDQGYSVSIFPRYGKVVNGKLLERELELYWIDRESLQVFHREDLALGTWYDEQEDKTYLDIVVIVDHKERALELGRQYHQKAIWDFKNKEEIFLKRLTK